MAVNEIYQYSIMSALMDGVGSRGIPVSQLLANGDFGLGTFQYMAGEMIVFDGRLWQMNSDGTVYPIDPTNDHIISPFAVITRFQPTLHTTVSITGKHDLAEQLSGLFPTARNLFVAIRIDGAVKSVTVRTAAGQQYPGQKLVEISHAQVVHTFSGPGTLVGFRSPEYIQGIGVAGVHLHFITADLKQGGHVLEIEADDVELRAAVMSRVHLELPADDADFNAAELRPDVGGIAKVEG